MKSVGQSVELATWPSAATATERMKRIVSELKKERQKGGVEEDPNPQTEGRIEEDPKPQVEEVPVND